MLLDGGLASELESRGFKLKSRLWSAELLLHNTRAIIDSHTAYVKAGADIISTASYQATMQALQAHGMSEEDAVSLLLKSVDIACAVARSASKQRNHDSVLVAASIGPYGAFLADGAEYRGNYGKSVPFLEGFHRQRIQILDQSEADILACETIPDYTEAQALNNLLHECCTPSWVSFSCRDEDSLHDGTPIEQAAMLFQNNPRVLAIGINCTNPALVSGLMQKLLNADTGKHIVVYPNAGEQYCSESKTWHASASAGSTAKPFSIQAMEWAALGADIVGGCCRVGPGEISEIRALLDTAL